MAREDMERPWILKRIVGAHTAGGNCNSDLRPCWDIAKHKSTALSTCLLRRNPIHTRSPRLVGRWWKMTVSLTHRGWCACSSVMHMSGSPAGANMKNRDSFAQSGSATKRKYRNWCDGRGVPSKEMWFRQRHVGKPLGQLISNRW